MTRRLHGPHRSVPFSALPALVAVALAAGCAGDDQAAAPTTTAAAPAPAPQLPPAPAPISELPSTDSRGVLDYGDYAVVQARSGDTVESMAARVGVSPSELASYNGLPTSYSPRAGDELVLPPKAGGYGAAAAPAPAAPGASPMAPAAGPVSGDNSLSGPAAVATGTAAGAAASADGGWSPSRISEAIDGSAGPAASGGTRTGYHEVQPGETVYSIARLYNVPAATVVSWNALRAPDYAVTPGQVLTIPQTAQLPAATSEPTAPGQSAPATPPPSAGAPLPPDQTAAAPLESPQLGQYQTAAPAAAPAPAPGPAESTPPATAAASAETVRTAATSPSADAGSDSGSGASAGSGDRLARPVQGEVLRPYSRAAGASQNDGVDFAATAGEPVRAAADGTVALVSTSLGDWGTIVLVRHDSEIMTVYGRLGEVAVSKGQQIARGQTIGTVADGDPPMLHFEVRRGAFSENPETYF